MLSLGLGSCGLFNTGDPETSTGRGTKVFDPYAGPESGAIRLTLQLYNGCAIKTNGEFASRGNANIPYPTEAECQQLGAIPTQPPGFPRAPLPLVAGTTYFLHQFSLIEVAENKHTDGSNMNAVLDWMRNETRFKSADWSNVGIVSDKFVISAENVNPYAYDRVVDFGNANWMKDQNDTFLVEVLDVDGNPRQSITYERRDFFAENPETGHTRVSWIQNSVGPPRFPGDTEPQPVPPAPAGFPAATTTHTTSLVRFDMEISTNPTKSFRLDPALVGDGAIRVTWSKLPDTPFYFPVTFTRPEDIPPTCYDANDPSNRVPCNFGLKPEVQIAPPANGKFFVPGERISFRLLAKDGSGNLLHDPEHFPTWNDFAQGRSNGISYGHYFHLIHVREADTISGWQFSGPHQAMRVPYELAQRDYFITPSDAYVQNSGWGSESFNPIGTNGPILFNVIGGVRDYRPPTNYIIDLPADAKPGTYTLYFKVNRQFMGEDFTKMVPVDVQVDLPEKTSSEKTSFPGRVGNCQICHRGVLSMENVRHGLPVDYVEGCKSCHNRNSFLGGTGSIHRIVHQVHSSSAKYPQPKNDCTMCHLTRESALRPSLIVCGSCHPQVHGTAFFKQSLESGFLPTENGRYGNCAEDCHQQTPPTAHILPRE
jgi:hypothetical protein